jgi:hypothetical protein
MTVVREIPSRSAIRAFGTPSAASLRINAQSSKVITLPSLSDHFSPPKLFSFRAPPTLRPERQPDRYSAPEGSGSWAFPWPLFEPTFAMHQFRWVVPLSLVPDHPSAYVDEKGHRPPVGTTIEQVWATSEFRLPADYGDRLARWIRDVGPQALRLRRFWYDGDLYTHLNPNGTFLDTSEWHRMSARTFANAVRRVGGTRRWTRTYDGGLELGRLQWNGRFEVFIPSHRGRFTGHEPNAARGVAAPRC